MNTGRTDKWQLLPPLSAREYAALKESIQAYGILVPVTVDVDTGELLDGHHRARIAEELGIELREFKHKCSSDAERAAFAIVANIERRQLSPEQVRELRSKQQETYLALRRQNHTQSDAANAVGVPRETARDWEGGSNGGSAITSPLPDLHERSPRYAQVLGCGTVVSAYDSPTRATSGCALSHQRSRPLISPNTCPDLD